MPVLPAIVANWQKALPILAGLGIVAWLAVFHADPTSERALFAALLVIYMLHQIEEHLWPGLPAVRQRARVQERRRQLAGRS